MSKLLRVYLPRLLLTLLLPLLSSCSVMQLGYNNAQVPLYWWLNGYLDFSPAQSNQVQAELANIHRWHRQNELAHYALTLRHWQSLVLSQVSAEQVCALWGELTDSLLRVQQRLEAPVATLALTLTPEQLEHLTRKFEKRNQKWREEWLDVSAEQQLERRMDQFEERVEMLYGALNKSQLTMLRNQLAESAFDPRIRLNEIERRQQDTLSTLRSLQANKANAQQARVELIGLLDRMANPTDPRYLRYRNRLQEQHCTTLADLHNSTSRAQRHKAAEKLEKYEALAQKLASRQR
ncbi:MAG: DUF6279 family lipoprotein [Burkholderiaceae bacterium]